MIDQATAEFISLTLSSPTLYYQLLVIIVFFPRTIEIIKNCNKKHYSEPEWLILGITLSCSGALLDGAYWGIAWGLKYFAHDAATWWFNSGVYANVPFRQIMPMSGYIMHVCAIWLGQSRMFVIYYPIGLTLLTAYMLIAAK